MATVEGWVKRNKPNQTSYPWGAVFIPLSRQGSHRAPEQVRNPSQNTHAELLLDVLMGSLSGNYPRGTFCPPAQEGCIPGRESIVGSMPMPTAGPLSCFSVFIPQANSSPKT